MRLEVGVFVYACVCMHMSVCVCMCVCVYVVVCGEAGGVQPESGVWPLRVSLFVLQPVLFFFLPGPFLESEGAGLCFQAVIMGPAAECCQILPSS